MPLLIFLYIPKNMFCLFHLGRINNSEDIQRCLKYIHSVIYTANRIL